MHQSNSSFNFPSFQAFQDIGKVAQFRRLNSRPDFTFGNELQNFPQVLYLASIREDVAESLPSSDLHMYGVFGVETTNA